MDSLLGLFRLELSPLELIVRGTAIYWFLLLVFRFVLRRDAGSLGVADLLFVVLIADASSNAMQGEYRTVGDGLVLALTLATWNYAIDWASFRSPRLAAFFEPPAEPLVKHGKLVWRTLRKERITKDELLGKLRQQGIDDLACIRVARLESDGQISVIRMDGASPPPGDAPPVR